MTPFILASVCDFGEDMTAMGFFDFARHTPPLPARCSAGAVADDGNRLVVIDLRRRDPTPASGLIRESQSFAMLTVSRSKRSTRTSPASSNWSWRIGCVVFMRTHSKCAHLVRPPPAKLAAICSQPVRFRVRRMRGLGCAPKWLQPVVGGRTSVHPGNDALCRPRVLGVGWSERLLKDGLLNVDPIADRD